MSRQKPRFTPDPPPYNATGEQILAWVNAQLQRIEDYWPRDDGDRITALEELQSKYSGEWSISGQSLIRFEGTTGDLPYVWSCAQIQESSIALDHSADGAAGYPVHSFNYSASKSSMYVSGVGIGLYEIASNIASSSQVVAFVADAPTSYSAHLYDDSGVETITVAYKSGTSWIFKKIRTSDNSTLQTAGMGASGLEYWLGIDTKDYLIGISRQSSRIVAASKSDHTNDGVGFSASANHGLLKATDAAANKFSSFALTSASVTESTMRFYEWTVTAGTPPTLANSSFTIDLSTAAPLANKWSQTKRIGVAFRNDAYWMPIENDSVGSERCGFLPVSPSGTAGDPVWVSETQNWAQIMNFPTASTSWYGVRWPAYDAVADKFYWPLNSQICRYDPETSAISCCTISDPEELKAGDSLEYSVYIGIDPENNLWAIQADAGDPSASTYATLLTKLDPY